MFRLNFWRSSFFEKNSHEAVSSDLVRELAQKNRILNVS